MRLQHRHGTYMTSHGDELRRLPIQRPTPWAWFAALVILLIVAGVALAVIAVAVTTSDPLVRWTTIAVGLLATWLMGRGARA